MNSIPITTEWSLPKTLKAPDIEDWMAGLPPATGKVVLRLGAWKKTDPFADAHLQGVLCMLQRKGIRIRAAVPPLTLTGNRAKFAFSTSYPMQMAEPLTPTEKKLSASVAGLSIGQLCKFDQTHCHIPKLQLQALVERRYLFGSGPELALAVPANAKESGYPRKSTLDREATFNNRFRQLLAPLGISNSKPYAPENDWFNQLKTFAFEACENTWDHGRLNFEGNPISSIRFVRLRRIDVTDKSFDLAESAPGFEEQFDSYLKSLYSATDLGAKWSPDGGRLIEVTIADGGVGIAARMAGGLHVFDGQLATERKYLLNALPPDRTTKSASEAGRGQGFRKMLRACFRLSGLTIVRTGRLRLFRTYRKHDGTNENPDFNRTTSDAYLLRSNSSALPLLAGTSVSLIFPIGPPGCSS